MLVNANKQKEVIVLITEQLNLFNNDWPWKLKQSFLHELMQLLIDNWIYICHKNSLIDVIKQKCKDWENMCPDDLPIICGYLNYMNID